MLLTGSEALLHHSIHLGRKPKDIDFICTKDEYTMFLRDGYSISKVEDTKYGVAIHTSNAIFDFEIAEQRPSSLTLLDIMSEQGFGDIAPPEVILTLKLSHRYLRNSPHFSKTMSDIKLLRGHGYEVPDYLTDWLPIREKETYDYAHPSLNQMKSNFFTDNVKYVYDHDSIHEAVKMYDLPAYTYFKKDDADVMCSKDKFFSLPKHIQEASVLEESFVLALERHQIPNDFKPEPVISFLIALEKVCTSITSGWWREFAWESYDDIIGNYLGKIPYVDKFNHGLQTGIVKPHVST